MSDFNDDICPKCGGELIAVKKDDVEGEYEDWCTNPQCSYLTED